MKNKIYSPTGKLSTICGKPLALIGNDIDTDRIIPARFLKCVSFDHLGKSVFADDRKNLDGNHPFDLEKNQGASILIVNCNFGCGSSREHAVWSLMDFGFKVVIAESFADIFYNNCFNNGLLPIVISEHEISTLLDLSEERKEIEIDLQNQIIFVEDKEIAHFEIDPFRKKCILEGLDEIGLSLTHSSEIKEFEKKHYLKSPWIFNKENN